MEMFPKENKIKVKYNLFQTLCKANIKKPCTDFMTNSVKYLEKIAMRDEQFFIGENKPGFLESINFTSLWNETTDDTKNVMWKYIQSFFVIGIKVIEMPPETHGLINYIINYKN
jgi:hypothetical protein